MIAAAPNQTVVPVTVDALMTALGNLPTPAWYETEPFRTLVAVIIGGILTLTSTLIAHWWLAFQGEISALRRALRADTDLAWAGYQSGGTLTDYRTDYPTTIYEKNAGQIGDLRDPTLVRQLVSFYGLLHRLETYGKWIKEQGRYTPDTTRRFIGVLAACLHGCTLIDMRLAAHTAGLKVDALEIPVSPEDASDRNLALEILQKTARPEDRLPGVEQP